MPENTEKNRDPKKEGLTVVLMRNAFYRDQYTRAIVAFTILFFVNVVLLAAVVDHYLNPPQPQYFATNSRYQLIKWHPLSDPVVDNNFVLQWVSNAVQAAFSLDYIHWRQQLQNASYNFTPGGWQLFINSFQTSGDLDTLVKLSMVSDVSVTGSPRILYQGVLGGRYVWKIQMPILIKYVSPKKTIPQPLSITLIVVRVPVEESADQIAINEFLPQAQGELTSNQ